MEAAREATRLAHASGDVEVLLGALLARGFTAFEVGKLDEAAEQLSTARSRASEAGRAFKTCQAKHALAWVALSRSDEQRASALLQDTLEAAREAGYRSLAAQCINGLAELARFHGDAPEARERYRRYGELKREMNSPYEVAISHLNLAQAELMAARFPAAVDHLDDAERQLDDLSKLDSKIHLLRVARLTHAAGTDDGSTFDDLLSTYADGWPEDARLIKDHPWLVEMAGDYAADADDPDRARKAWRLARDLWNQLDDDASADQVTEKLDALTDR